MINQAACMLVGYATTIPATWCVYEHSLVDPTGVKPPETIYINCCLLRDVYTLADASHNSEWHKMMLTNTQPLAIRIIMITDDHTEAMNYAVKMTRNHNPMPRCNLHGYMMNNSNRPIMCSNGQRYSSQSEACRLLNLSQSGVSEHLNGKRPKGVKGLTFRYLTADEMK